MSSSGIPHEHSSCALSLAMLFKLISAAFQYFARNRGKMRATRSVSNQNSKLCFNSKK